MPPRPTIRFLLTISDVGERGGELSLQVTPATEESKFYTGSPWAITRLLALYLDPDALKDHEPAEPRIGAIRRLLYGADQPT